MVISCFGRFGSRSFQRPLIYSISHQKNVTAEEERKAKKRLLENKNKNSGINLGRLCMKLYLKGCPYADHEDDLLEQKMNGTVVGELNHSRKFSAAFRPFSQKASSDWTSSSCVNFANKGYIQGQYQTVFVLCYVMPGAELLQVD